MDECPECGHDWHGLTCEAQRLDTRLVGPGYSSGLCGCPSRFVDDTPAARVDT